MQQHHIRRLALSLFLLFPMPTGAAQRQVLRRDAPAASVLLAPVNRLSIAKRLDLAIGLPLRNKDALRDLLQEIYDPASTNYHHYLTPEEFTRRFGPTEEEYQAVVDFAIASGLSVTAAHPNRTLLDVSGSVADIEKALHVTLRVYQHPKEARTFYAPEPDPSLDLSVPLLHISGLDNYVVPQPMSLRVRSLESATGATPAAGSGPSGAYMGNDFRAAYLPGVSLVGTGQSVGLVEFDGFYATDITTYESQAGLPNVQLKTVLLDGFNGTPGGNNVEVALDIDMAICVAPNLSAVIIYEGLLPNSVLNRMATDNLAKSLSASWIYGIDSSTEQIFQQFAVQGQSFFNASGDNDAWVGSVPTPCDDPYVTIVGGTTLTTSGPGGGWVSETVWNWGGGTGTGGGISTSYPIPSWQQGISMAANHGSTTMRNIPDVAMTADNIYVIADGGTAKAVGGTSAATPLWAGLIALVNQQAAGNGRPSAGFINPAIYELGTGASYASAFHDITTGDNTGPQSPTNFFAVAGYDLCTGWGTPQGISLINALATPEPLQIAPGAGFTASGGSGGPFTVISQNCSLTNIGPTPLNWMLANPAPWLSAAPSAGTINPGGSAAVVTVDLNAAASNLLVGVCSANLWFTNLNDGVAQSRQFTLAVVKPPVITTQPTNQDVLGGATAVFTVAAAGGYPLTYQWRDNGTSLTDHGNISGSATAILTVSNVSLVNTGAYTVVVSNVAGAVTSTPPAVLTLIPSRPVITMQPASQTVLFGAPVELKVAALGNAPLTYKWQTDEADLADGDTISGSATSTLKISAASSTTAGTYSVIISNALGSTTSTGAVVTVYAPTDWRLIQNGGFETGDFSFWTRFGNLTLTSVGADGLCAHSDNFGALLGSVGSLGYLSQAVPTSPGGAYLLSLWLDSPDGIQPNEFQVTWDGTTVFDQTNLTAIGWTNLQFIVTAAGTSTTLEFGFRDDATFLGLDDISVTPLLSPAGPPVITTQPPSQTVVVEGVTATIVAGVAGRLPLYYQWRFEGTNVINATDATLTVPDVSTNQMGDYSLLVTNALGSAASSNAALTVVRGSLALATFDELSGSSVAVPDGYNNVVWSNFWYLDAVHYKFQNSGYRAGMVSPNNVGLNAFANPASISSYVPFSLISAYLTAAWNDNLRLEVKGYVGATLIYEHSYILSATSPTLIQFNCVGVTKVEFISSGGTPHPGFGGLGAQFVIDNVSLVTTPPPPLVALYSFNGLDGGYPSAELVQGADGNFYGTTGNGGTYGVGTIFRLTTNGTSTLVSFNGANGRYPNSGLVQGADGNFYGTTSSGGAGIGTVFSLKPDGTLTTLGSFSDKNGYYPSGELIQGADGNLYGTASYGGTYGNGTVFSITTNGTLATLVSFNTTNGSNPSAGLVQGADGNLYGTTPYGGTYGNGTVFKITNDGTLSTLVSFNYANGAYPSGGLVQGADGNLYGTTPYGGTYGNGTVFSITTNGTVATLVSFKNANGLYPYAGLARGVDGNFYGTTTSGGTYGNGTLFRMTTNGTLNTLRSFAGTNGALPHAALVQGSDGNFYGTTLYGGVGYNGSSTSGGGTVFRLEFNSTATPPAITAQPVNRTVPLGGTGTFSVSANSSGPLNYFWQRNGALIAGATQSRYTTDRVQSADSGSRYSCVVSNSQGSGLSSNALLVVLPPSASGPVYAFNGADGGYSYASLAQGADHNFYGTTTYGGMYGNGTVFKMATDGTLTTLVSFNTTNGSNPSARLVQGADANFYGTTPVGGTYGNGTVFKMTTDGTLTTLVSFNIATGATPYAGLVQGADGNFYGPTANGGTYGYGTVFRVTTNGELSTLVSFNTTNGSYPYARLVAAVDGNLYGTTVYGGTYGYGTLFSLTTNGTLTSLLSFNSAIGVYPYSELVQGADGSLYGTTSYGGTSGYGTAFGIATEGVLTTLVSFDYATGAYPYAGLVQGADGNFYGTTPYGGTSGNGTVFEMTTDGTLTNLLSLDGTIGVASRATLVESSDGNFYDGTFYGTTPYGGAGFDGSSSSGNGTVFRVVVASAAGPVVNTNAVSILAQPASRRVLLGDTNVSFSILTKGPVYSRQWYTNGVAVPGATHSTYLAPTIVASDNGAQVYVVVRNNVNTVQSSNAIITVGQLVKVSGIQEQLWFGATRADVEGGLYDAITPDRQLALSAFSSPQEQGANFTERLSGLFVPAVTTNYTFFITSDDDSDLFLGTNSTPASKTLIAQEVDWSNPLTWTLNTGGTLNRQLEQKRSDQWSPDGGTAVPNLNGIHLVAGQAYYIEAVHGESYGGDEVDVTFKMVGEPDPADGDLSRIVLALLAPFAMGLDGGYIVVTNPPQSIGAFQNENATFIVGAGTGYIGDTSGRAPGLAYQWQRAAPGSTTFEDVPGARGSSYTTPILTLSDNGTQFRVSLLAADATTNSNPASLTVLLDSNGDGIPDDWAIAHGLSPTDPSVALGDPDGDGCSNLMEYALGTDPHNPADGKNAILFSTAPSGGVKYLSMTFKRRKIASGLQYIPEVSADKQTWYSDSTHLQQTTITPLDPQFDWVTFQDATPLNPAAPRFMRLRLN